MSTTEKKVIAFEESQLLQDLGIESDMDRYYDVYREEKSHEKEVKRLKKDRDQIGESLYDLFGAAEADTVTAKIDDDDCRFTVVPGDPDATVLDAKKLALNLQKIGKLSAELIKTIISASQKPKPRKGYIKFTIGKEETAEAEE